MVSATGNCKLLETYRRLVRELSLFRHAAPALHADATTSPRGSTRPGAHACRASAVGVGKNPARRKRSSRVGARPCIRARRTDSTAIQEVSR